MRIRPVSVDNLPISALDFRIDDISTRWLHHDDRCLDIAVEIDET